MDLLFLIERKIAMRKIIRALLAGWGAKKLGGKTGCGCFGTIIVFIILWWLLSNLGI
jgi:hypothetical protein